MSALKGFLLSAGFGTRFQPQSLFLPKPALPFLNLPQALFPAAALKSAGVTDFFYNSHHLANELDQALTPYFGRPSIFEKDILDSAGGIANAKEALNDQENFWVANGDSLVFLNDQNVLKDAYNFHIKENATATLVGIKKDSDEISGLDFNPNSTLKGLSKSKDALHFIGFYIFNKSIFKHLKNGKHHIFRDLLLNQFEGKTTVFNAEERISWYETGNESDFLTATSERLKDLSENGEKSSTYRALIHWDPRTKEHLNHFIKHKVWGNDFVPSTKLSDFLCIGAGSKGDFNKLSKSVLGENLNFKSESKITNKVLVHSSQWA